MTEYEAVKAAIHMRSDIVRSMHSLLAEKTIRRTEDCRIVVGDFLSPWTTAVGEVWKVSDVMFSDGLEPLHFKVETMLQELACERCYHRNSFWRPVERASLRFHAGAVLCLSCLWALNTIAEHAQ